jgi:hypothetical protein
VITVPDFPLADVSLDAQVREAIHDGLVTVYMARMREGTVFPKVTLFYDGTTHFVADGNHRCLAARRLGLTTIAATVQPGTKADAMWHGLAANQAHGLRFTSRDVRHQIALALTLWPDRSGLELAKQIGCSQGYFSKVRHQLMPTNTALADRIVRSDGRTCPATYRQRGSPVTPLHDEIVARLKAGQHVAQIRAEIGARPEHIAQIRRALGIAGPDNSRAAIEHRRNLVRSMAAEGYTTRQIAAAAGVGISRVGEIAKRIGVVVTADLVVGKTNHHDSNRIVSRIVEDAENLVECVNLIDFEELDQTQVPEWLRSLMKARANLTTFIKRLSQETSREAA